MTDPTAANSAITIDPTSAIGYRRMPDLQARFEEAARRLLEQDGWRNPQSGNRPELVADLALEGGGVKGIGLVGAVLVLSEAGYSFRGVAGTSAGAIAASLIAALTKAGKPMTELKSYVDSMKFSNFMPEGKVHHFLEHRGGKVGTVVADSAILAERMGLYPGDYLRTWLGPILSGLGVETFEDLALTTADDPDMSLPPGHAYRLVVHTSDITREELVRLPWDFPIYGHDPDGQDVVQAIRASMSIPFFFEPVTFHALPAVVKIPRPDGGTISQQYEGGTVTWVDGALRNFPIGAFDRVDDKPPRWPTIGIKLSSLQTTLPATDACEGTLAVAVRCLHTMMNEWDAYNVDATTAARTIFVDNAGLTATDFDLTAEQQNRLFLNGVTRATEFVIEMGTAGHVPRTAAEAKQAMRARTARGPASGAFPAVKSLEESHGN